MPRLKGHGGLTKISPCVETELCFERLHSLQVYKTTDDMVDVSNARPIGILAGYLLACAGLTAYCIGMTWKRGSSPRSTIDQRRRNAIVVFSALAALSLATTWYHMFCFFPWSYREWETPRAAAGPLSVDRDGLYLGDWLRDTTLFKQAWVSTLETPLRAWWSTQIFGFCAIWSVMLAAQGMLNFYIYLQKRDAAKQN